jgi:hypothetical protein
MRVISVVVAVVLAVGVIVYTNTSRPEVDPATAYILSK